MHSYAATMLQIFTKLRLPNSVPYIFTALRVSVPSSVISALVSDTSRRTSSAGRQIRENIVLASMPPRGRIFWLPAPSEFHVPGA
jgi:NitT/TauT family transport system permease protein